MASISLKYKSKQGNLTAPGDVDPGAMIPIATTTVGAGGSGTITFSNIPQNYEHLQVRYLVLSGSAGNTAMKINGDGGTNYAQHQLYGDGSTAGSNSASSVTQMSGNYIGGSTYPGSSVIDILDYANTNKYKTVRFLGGADANGSGYIQLWSGLWQSTSAVNQLTFTVGGNFQQYSSIALYGIKRAGA